LADFDGYANLKSMDGDMQGCSSFFPDDPRNPLQSTPYYLNTFSLQLIRSQFKWCTTVDQLSKKAYFFIGEHEKLALGVFQETHSAADANELEVRVHLEIAAHENVPGKQGC
jgi:hypothetical protein